MAKHRWRLNILVLLAVVIAGIVFIQRPFPRDERRIIFRTPLTGEARLLKGIPSQSKTVRLNTFRPNNASLCRDAPAPVEAALTVEAVERALNYKSAIAGFHSKAGMLSAVQWRPEFKRKRNLEVSYWFAYPLKRRSRCLDVQPPLQFPGCRVMINHHYKFIWIRGHRVGSSLIERSLKGNCSESISKNGKLKHCSESLHDNEEVSLKDVGEYWNNYFVFAFVRNPYSRFASAYMHVSRLMGDCPKLVNFSKLCDSPFLLARICSTLSCCWPGAIAHHMQHAVEQSSCLFTETGEVAVDFIGQTENLNEDLKKILNIINNRKASNLPKLKIKGGSLPKQDALMARRPVHLYSRNSTCLSRIEHYYWKDFDRLRYKRVTAATKQ